MYVTRNPLKIEYILRAGAKPSTISTIGEYSFKYDNKVKQGLEDFQIYIAFQNRR